MLQNCTDNSNPVDRIRAKPRIYEAEPGNSLYMSQFFLLILRTLNPSDMSKDVLSVLIIEDEIIWSATLEIYLRDFGFEVAGVANTFEQAVILLNKKNYDLVLLDISLEEEKSGLELARLINTLYKKPFIFITASYSSHTLQEAVDTTPSGYLSKPVSENSLFITIQNAIRHFETHQTATPLPAEQPAIDTCFYVKQGNGYIRVDWSDVAALSVEHNYTRVLTLQNKGGYLIRSALQKTLDAIIPAAIRNEFIRVNRSEVVRARFIEELRGQSIITSLKTFSITESYLKEVKQKLQILS